MMGPAIAKRDGDTDAHNYRVTIYSVRLAEKEGLSDKAIQGLIKGAFLHDIGKIGIREEGRGNHFDPDLLTSFLQIAPALHAELVNSDIEGLRTAMHQINRRYFASGLETLLA